MTCGGPVRERAGIPDEFHRDPEPTPTVELGHVRTVEPSDPWMLELGQEPGFRRPQRTIIGTPDRGHHLDGNVATDSMLDRFEHPTEPALPHGSHERELAEHRAGTDAIRGGCSTHGGHLGIQAKQCAGLGHDGRLESGHGVGLAAIAEQFEAGMDRDQAS
jgi:hypothetical protein